LNFAPRFGWRNIYLFTAIFGILLSYVIFFGVADIRRGASEPELNAHPDFQTHRLELKDILSLFKIRSLRYLMLQGLFGVLPWQVITFWSFRYLEIERGYNNQTISSIMIPAVLMIGAGYFLGGVFGDLAYKKTITGRLYVSAAGIVLGAVFLSITLSLPNENVSAFRILMSITSFFIPLASPNIATSVYDVVLPEVRSSATSIQYFLGNIGSAFAPLLAGMLSAVSSLHTALLGISLGAWLVTALILGIGIYHFPADVLAMRKILAGRSSKG
jgi:MFS family permease